MLLRVRIAIVLTLPALAHAGACDVVAIALLLHLFVHMPCICVTCMSCRVQCMISDIQAALHVASVYFSSCFQLLPVVHVSFGNAWPEALADCRAG